MKASMKKDQSAKERKNVLGKKHNLFSQVEILYRLKIQGEKFWEIRFLITGAVYLWLFLLSFLLFKNTILVLHFYP